MLSWVFTVHKVKGLSLTSAVFSSDLEKQKSFNEGQMYVTLSRVTSIDNLFLIGKYNRKVFKVNESVVAEYNKLRENRSDAINTNYVDHNSRTVLLYTILTEARWRYQQSQAAHRKRYSLLDRK